MVEKHILQVSELTKKVKFLLESEINTVWLCGEISNFIAASSGHWYLSLKDQKSQVKCAMFKGSNRRTRMTPSNGKQVLVRAKVSLYEPRGDFQLIIDLMEDAGEGLLRQQFEQVKQKLNAQGLFAQHHKQSIPAHVTRLGIVTSPTGAAVKDILSVLNRRNRAINVIIYPTLVQGDTAKHDIEQAINIANSRQETDVLIVGRGGGSLEDLWPFNEENVVTAIFNSQIPVISAVGHEIDTTLSDYVADLRAPTPSAAAELVSQDTNELLLKINAQTQRASRSISSLMIQSTQRLKQLRHRLSMMHPEQHLRSYQQKYDELNFRLSQAVMSLIKSSKQLPLQLANRLHHLNPTVDIKREQQNRQQLTDRLLQAMHHLVQQKQNAFVHQIEQLQLVSPLATIARGYSVSRNNTNQIVTSIKDVNDGEPITIQVTDGIISAEVKKTHHKDE